MIPTDCPDCNRLIGIVCPAHCLGVHCLDGFHVDLCVGPGRRLLLESFHRRGVPVTPAFVAAFDAAEAAIAEALR